MIHGGREWLEGPSFARVVARRSVHQQGNFLAIHAAVRKQVAREAVVGFAADLSDEVEPVVTHGVNDVSYLALVLDMLVSNMDSFTWPRLFPSMVRRLVWPTRSALNGRQKRTMSLIRWLAGVR